MTVCKNTKTIKARSSC